MQSGGSNHTKGLTYKWDALASSWATTFACQRAKQNEKLDSCWSKLLQL